MEKLKEAMLEKQLKRDATEHWDVTFEERATGEKERIKCNTEKNWNHKTTDIH